MDRMLSVERVKELIPDRSLSDEEAKQIRDELRTLAEIVARHLLSQQRASAAPKSDSSRRAWSQPAFPTTSQHEQE